MTPTGCESRESSRTQTAIGGSGIGEGASPPLDARQVAYGQSARGEGDYGAQLRASRASSLKLVTLLSSGTGFERQSRLAAWIVDGHAQYSSPRYGIRDSLAVEERLRAAPPVMHSHGHLLPPRLESTLARIEVEIDSNSGLHTVYSLPKIALLGIRRAVPIVGINRTAAVVARIDVQ